MKFIYAIFFISVFSSCTISINQVHTQGEASDIVDETQATQPEISPSFNVEAETIKYLRYLA